MSYLPEFSPPTEILGQFNLPLLADHHYWETVRKGVPMIEPGTLPGIKADPRKVAIIGGGPTLKQTLPSGKTILESLNDRKDLIKVITGGTHGSLERFTDIDYAVIGLADKAMVPYFATPRKDITYIVAAQADPEIFDRLIDSGVTVYAFDAFMYHINERKHSIGPGSTAVTSALAVMAALGKNEFEFYGVDGSTTYAFEDIRSTNSCKVGKYAVAMNFMPQLREFQTFVSKYPNVSVNFNGDCAHAELFNTYYATPQNQGKNIPSNPVP